MAGYEDSDCDRSYEDHSNEVVREVLKYLIPRIFRIETNLHSLKELAMSNQEQLDTLTAKVTTLGGDVTALVTSQNTLITATNDLTAEVKKLSGANPDLDFTAVNAAADAADVAIISAKTSVDTAVTNNPDPGPPAA